MIRWNLSEICDENNKEPEFSKSARNISELVIPALRFLHIWPPVHMHICMIVLTLDDSVVYTYHEDFAQLQNSCNDFFCNHVTVVIFVR